MLQSMHNAFVQSFVCQLILLLINFYIFLYNKYEYVYHIYT